MYGTIDSGDEAGKDDIETGEYESEDSSDEYYVPEDVVDNPEETEEEVVAEVCCGEKFLESFDGEDRVLGGNLKGDVLKSMSASGWEDVVKPDIYEYLMAKYEPVSNTTSYPGLHQGYSGPSAEALRHGDSPVALFFYMMPVVLWLHIAVCSNEYHREMLPDRVDGAYQRYRKKRRRDTELPRKTRRDIQHDMETMKPMMPHELCRFVGLLVARTIAPNREKLSNHSKTQDVGAISRGCFGFVLDRDRFMEISRNLHFNPNNDPRARTDHAWKIRKVVERTFAQGYVCPSHLAFDEAVLPSRSSFNKMRVYMKDKPHKWGAKFFMLCSVVTAYCIRMLFMLTCFELVMTHIDSFEVYCGKKRHTSDAHRPDMKSVPAAVVRNLLEVFAPDARKQGMIVVVIDRFYTSVALAIQLLLMGFYCVGTIMTNRLGYCKEVIEKKKTRSSSIIRGSFKMARSKLVPCMTAISWWDSRPVHFLCTGGSSDIDRVVRQDGVDKVEVSCPRVIKDYHAFMGGVDAHDQLHLQRYLLQRALRFKKYYKSLVLGLIDLAIVNGYIIHKAYYKNKESRPLTYVKYMIKLHLQLCQLQATDMYEGNTFGTEQPAPAPTYEPLPVGGDLQTEHVARQSDEWCNEGTQAKRCQRTCKVCSVLRAETQRASTTTYFCNDCNTAGPIFLCMRARRNVRGVAMTCWDIWHKEWVNGKLIPVEDCKVIRVRRRRTANVPEMPSTPGTPASSKRCRTSP
ncbi:LOW QUALITY PROTEIN: Hypothetical protein PHPALM_5837 [Phytophthora palmivora]|uniref:PiggyBac transposable element-derived protein domain-containing protein n=1 Tax=Phytophthora palmivora TaxID=4796 RepID=A0A2P4YGF7_9STRA|nr:LOW QUALITY PROTEIN: Hypothetical protein PHPALM_5837 [Phytophthora palmivora]